MKIRIRHFAILVLSVAFCSFVAPDKSGDTSVDTTVKTQSDSAHSSTTSPKNDAANEPGQNVTATDEKPSRSIPLELILSVLALLAAVAVFLLDQKAIQREKRYLDDRIRQRKNEHLELENRLNKLEKAVPEKVRAVLQEQQDLFVAEQERKMQALREEAAAREEELRRQQEAAEAASRPYESKIYYASYKESVKGFAEDFLSEDKKANSTAVITTLSDDKAEFSLVSDINPMAFRSILDACEVVKGTPENYNTIEVVEPGRLEKDEDAWVVVSKVKIACV